MSPHVSLGLVIGDVIGGSSIFESRRQQVLVLLEIEELEQESLQHRKLIPHALEVVQENPVASLGGVS